MRKGNVLGGAVGILWLAACAIGCPAMAQPARTKPPKTTQAPRKIELDPTLQAAIRAAPNAAQFPNSDFVRLLDLGELTIAPDGATTLRARETLKLFNERARAAAEVSIPYNASYQTIRVLEARTIKKDGKILPVKPNDIRITAPYQEYLMYDDALAVSFSLPAIEDDCIIDYTYELTTKPLLMPGHYWAYWGFSGLEPVALSRYVVRAPADRPLPFRLYNAPTLEPTVTLSKDGKERRYAWERKNLAPIPLEPGMPPVNDLRIWMEFSSVRRWDDIAKWFWNLAQSQRTLSPALKATVARLTDEKPTATEKARALYDWVSNRVRYVGVELGMSAVKPHAAAEVHAKLYGDCKDKTILLITMLQAVGVKAYPALLRAGEPGLIESRLPNVSAFNHCIAYAEIEGKTYWLDATAETCAFGDIPESDRGCQALVVREGEGGAFQQIPPYTPEENGVRVTSRIALRRDGGATAQTDIAMLGGSGQQMRSSVRALIPERRKEMMQRMAQSFSAAAELKDWKLSDPMRKEGAFTLQMTADAPNYAEKTGDLLLIPTSGIENGSERKHPFVKAERVHPIVEPRSSRAVSETTFTLPEGYALLDLPEEITLANAIQTYRRKVVRAADGRSVTITETMEQRAGSVSPADYAKIRGYYADLLKSARSKIVLKKDAQSE